MAKAKDFMKDLLKIEGAVVDRINPHLNVLETQSPSVNYTFGKGWGLPQGCSLLLWGQPKGGKTLISSSFIAQMHQDDDEAVAIRFDTESRERFQFGSEEELRSFGIDPERYFVYEGNSASIFDTITNKVAAVCDAGAKVKLVIIDPISGIVGRKMSDADSVNQAIIGDEARTIQDGLKRVLEVQRKYKFSLILTAQERANMDPSVAWGGPKTKPAVSFAVKHHCEYWMHVAKIEGKSGKSTWAGVALEDKSRTGFNDTVGEATGHRIRATMTEASFGAPKYRKAEFTVDYHKGVTNTYEEVFVLGVGYGVIDNSSRGYFVYGDNKWHGQDAALNHLKQDKDLCKKIISDLKEKDANNAMTMVTQLEESPEPKEES